MADLTAKFEADFSAFNDAVRDAETELKEFASGASAVERALGRMADQFSGRKVIQDATLMAKAIEDIGGASTLTEAELARVGKTANEAVEKMRALGMEIPPALEKLAGETRDAANANESLTVSATNLVASYFTVQAAIELVSSAYELLSDQIKASISSAAEAEDNQAALLSALEAQGTAIPSVVAAYNDYATVLQQTTRFSDDAVTEAERILVQIGQVMPRDMEKAVKATANLATALKTDLSSAAMMVAKAAEGQTTALSRAGVVLDETTAKGGDFSAILDAIEASLHGAAEAAGDTFNGRLARLANTWDNVHEAIGRVVVTNETVLTAIDELNGLLNDNTSELNENATANNLVSDAVILFAKGLSLGVTGVDYFQQEIRDAIVIVDTLYSTLLKAATGLMEMTRDFENMKSSIGLPSSLSAENAALLADTIESTRARIGELDQQMADAKERSDDWSQSLGAFRDKLDASIERLEATRGQTRELAIETAGAADAWDRETVAINADAEALKERTKTAKEAQAAEAALKKEWDEAVQTMREQQAALARLQADYQRALGAANRDTVQAQIDNVWSVAAATAQAMNAAGVATQDAYDLIWKIAEQTTDNIIRKTLEADVLTRAHYQKLAEDAEVAYGRALAFNDQYTGEALESLRQQRDAAVATLENWETAANAALERVGGTADGTARAVHGVGQAFEDTGTQIQSFLGQSFKVPTGGPSDLNNAIVKEANREFGGGPFYNIGDYSRYKQRELELAGIYQSQPGAALGAGIMSAFGIAAPGAGGGFGGTVNVHPGAVTMNYPIMNDRQSMDQLASIVGEAVMSKLTRAGLKI